MPKNELFQLVESVNYYVCDGLVFAVITLKNGFKITGKAMKRGATTEENVNEALDEACGKFVKLESYHLCRINGEKE